MIERGRALTALNKAGVRHFFVAEGITGGGRATYGKPRQKYAHWLGEILPADDDAGYRLAKELTRVARERRMTAGDGRIHVGLLSGDQSSAASRVSVAGSGSGVRSPTSSRRASSTRPGSEARPGTRQP